MKSGYYLDTNRHLVGYLAEEEVTNTGYDAKIGKNGEEKPV